MSIENLARHVSRFVTVSELAAYWLVSPQQIRRHIETGELDAIRLGPRLYRIAVEDALRFEQRITRMVRAQQIVRPIRRSRS
jgi:excisionase family DNA binding protein